VKDTNIRNGKVEKSPSKALSLILTKEGKHAYLWKMVNNPN
jgi:hypothetical protein